MRKFKKTQVLLIVAAIAFGLSALVPLTANADETVTASTPGELKTALDGVNSGGTITLTSDIEYTDVIATREVEWKSFTLDLNGNTLTITISSFEYSGDGGITVGEGNSIFVIGPGTLNIDIASTAQNSGIRADGEFEADDSVYVNIKTSGEASNGIYAHESGSIKMRGNIAATGPLCTGAYALDGGEITFDGDVSAITDVLVDAQATGAYAQGDNSSVTINGNATATNIGAHVNGNSHVTINGNAVATGTNSGNWGALAFIGTIVINGDAIATGEGSYGTYSDVGGTVTVNRDVKSGDSSLSFQGYSPAAVGGDGSVGVYAGGDSKTIVDGEIVSSDIYILFGFVPKEKSDYEPVSTMDGYREYRDGDSIVWVKDDGSTPTTTPTPEPEPTEHEFDDVPKTGDDTINSSEAVMQIIALISLGIGGVAAGFIVYRKKQAVK